MNHLFQIKICGITTPIDATMACRAGADAIGVNFYPASPRFVDSEKARRVVESVVKFNSKSDRTVKIVGVFVNSTVAKIMEAVQNFELDVIQLHGDEDPTLIPKIRAAANAQKLRSKVIRAIRQPTASLPGMDFPFENEISRWREAGSEAVLLDAAEPGAYGGTGRVLDWVAIRNLQSPLPIILAGGLRAENVGEAINLSGVRAVDVASGVEAQTRRKR